jgi:murein DD-endopeptidase MepM/ murein hydrolase activator NlpD
MTSEQKLALGLLMVGAAGIAGVVVVAAGATAAVAASPTVRRRVVETGTRAYESLPSLPSLLPRAIEGDPLPDGRRPIRIPAFDNEGKLVLWANLILPPVAALRPPLPLPLVIGSGFELRDIASLALHRDFHEGVDIRAAQGTPLTNLEKGSVSWITSQEHGNAAGTSVTIRGDVSGLHTTYAHMSSLAPFLRAAMATRPSSSNGVGFPVGAVPVAAGQSIGTTGGAPGTWGAGRSTGPHLHLRIGLYTSPSKPNVNPRDVLPAQWIG